jgi:hypothetical protein
MNSEVALNKQNLLKQFEEANSFSESQHLYAGLIQAKKNDNIPSQLVAL